jgi:probable phosphoglycerate mutase
VSSPAGRARQTARAIAQVMPGAAVEIDDRWAEADVGIAEGLSFDELGVIAPDLAARLANGEAAIDWPGGESADALAERVSAAWRDLLHGTLPTIVVSHAGPLRVAAALAADAATADVPFLEPGAFLRLPGPIRSRDVRGRMLRFPA